MDEGMQQGTGMLLDIFSINALDPLGRAALAAQATLILFFVVSPIMGYFIARAANHRGDSFIAASAALLIVSLANVALNYALRALVPSDRLTDGSIAVLSFVASLALAGLAARYLLWLFAPPKPIFNDEWDTMPDEEVMPFDVRRQERIARSKRARREG